MGNKNRHLFVLGLVLFVAAVLLTFNAVVSFANTDNVTVNVTVAAVTEITVLPHNLTWDAIVPGFTGGFRNVTVQNTGSVNATNLYAYITTLDNETIYPYSFDQAGLYAAGSVLVFRNESMASNMSWAGRLEWNWTTQIANTDLSAIPPLDRRAEGFLRNTTKQFYWAIGNGTNGTLTSGACNGTNAKFGFDSDEDNGTSITRTPDVTTGITRDTGDKNWSYFSINRPGILQGMCVAVHHNCT